MEENPVNHPGVPEEQYHTLGKKTLMIFVLERIQAAFVLLIAAVVLLILAKQSFVQTLGIPNLPSYLGIGAEICFLLFAGFFLFSFLIVWLIYANYKFCLANDSLKIKRGILNKEEVAIPYRQIQDVDINRDLSFQMMGLSRIVILTAGHEDESKNGESGESEGILPAIDKDLAEWLQSELLKRANLQKVVEDKE